MKNSGFGQYKKIGIITVVTGGLINALLMKNGIGGIVRELSRLSILIGIIFFLLGVFKKQKGSDPL